MNEIDITRLVEQIDNVDAREFWWDSRLLAAAAQVRDVRVVSSLARRHHCLSNKKAFSAHVVRDAIKRIDGQEFRFLWQIVDGESDTQRILDGLDDPFYLPWAAAFILGEVGGASGLRGAAVRLGAEHSVRHYMIVRITSHLVIRYLSIQSEREPTMTTIDLKTGERTSGVSTSAESPHYQMEMLRRSESNELFMPVEEQTLLDLKARLARIRDSIFNIEKQQFLSAIDKIPVRYA